MSASRSDTDFGHGLHGAVTDFVTRASRLVHIKSILIAYVAIGVIYSIVTPIFEASDELWHYPLVQWLSDGNPLPIQDPESVGPWKQEASQPPLYYALVGWATSWIDTGDMNDVLRPNPHVDNGVITLDGNINLVVHDPGREAFPWRGTVLAVHLARLLSVGMGAATIWLTYRLALELFPPARGCPPCVPPARGGDTGGAWFALSAAAVVAFTPMFLFISSAVNNDNLAVLLCTLALLLIVKRLRAPEEPATLGFRVGRWIPLGTVLGLAALTKTSALALLPVTALTVAVVAWKRRSWLELVAGALGTAVPLLLIAGWWYLRNIQLYGDVTGLNAFVEVLGRRAAPASLAQLWGERWGFMLSYWGLFGGVNVPMDDWVYHLLNALAWMALVGAVAYLISSAAKWFREDPGPPLRSPRPKGVGSLSKGQPRRDFGRDLSGYLQERIPLFAVGLFGVLVVAALTQWATVTWSSQGRLVFSAIAVWSIFLVLGLTGLLPDSAGRFAGAALGVCLFTIAAIAPFATIAPAYARPDPVTRIESPALSEGEGFDVPLDVEFGDRIRLLGANVDSRSARPGESIEITLYWQASAPMDRDYSTFVHLLDENEIVVAQRDMFPGQGLWPTSQMNVGDVIASRYVLYIPKAAYAPNVLTWEVGVYDTAIPGGPRLPALSGGSRPGIPMPGSEGSVSSGGDNVRFGSIALAPGPGDVPNPVAFNLGNQVELIGYDIDRRVAAPGETLRLTLYWRARSRMPIDYTVFTHVLEPPETLRAQHDKQLAPPTSTWATGQVVSDTYELTIKPDTPPGVYEVEIGVYDLRSSTFDRLRVLTDDGRITENYILLNKVRVR